MKARRAHLSQRAAFRFTLDPLESRQLLSASLSPSPLSLLKFSPGYTATALLPASITLSKPNAYATPTSVSRFHPIAVRNIVKNSFSAPTSAGITPAQLRQTYGANLVSFNGAPADGTGITIAIIDAYDYPQALTDANTFSSFYNLPLFNQGGSSPTLTRVSETGGSPPATTDPSGGWEGEEALDIQWAHAMAPMANIILVECTTDFALGINWARNSSPASVVSMSWSSDESTADPANNFLFTTPSTHTGVTFLAATGDKGAYSNSASNVIVPQYPAVSPQVVGVGGTTLHQSSGTWTSETAWGNGTSSQTLGAGGGGISTVEAQPAYQSGKVNGISSTKRSIPDVSIEADPNTGVFIVDSFNNPAATPWDGLWGGTSLACPIWAGIVAIADQGRTLNGTGTLDGSTQTLPTLYSLPASDFHDITAGSIGTSPTYDAKPGYDLASGRGTPLANLVIPALVNAGTLSGTVFQDNNSNTTQDPGEPALPNVPILLDLNNNGLYNAPATTLFSTSTPKPITTSSTVNSPLVVSGLTTPITRITLNFNITFSRDNNLTAYLVAPDNTVIPLFSAIGGSSANFTNTTIDDNSLNAINAFSAPFTGTFHAIPGFLSTLNGKSANGTWNLRITNSNSARTGSITSWSLSITTQGDQTTTTDANGNYAFAAPAGNYSILQTVPANFIQTTPAPNTPIPASLPANTSSLPNQNFADFPTLFTGTANADNYYLRQDPSSNLQIFLANFPAGTPAYTVPLSLLPNLTFNLLAGADTFTLDFSNGSPIGLNGISLTTAGDPNDTLRIIGQSPSQTLSLTNTTLAAPAGGTLTFSGLDTLAASNVTLNNAASIFPNLSIDPTATVTITNSGSPRALYLKTLSLSPGGKLDMTNNDLILDYSAYPNPAATIESLVASGYNHGNWLGAGITSSSAAANPTYSLNLLDNAAAPSPRSLFDSINIPTTAILIKFTYIDDLLLDGGVSSNDAIYFAAHYSEGAPATRAKGNITYTGTFNSNDAILFAANYNESLPPIPAI